MNQWICYCSNAGNYAVILEKKELGEGGYYIWVGVYRVGGHRRPSPLTSWFLRGFQENEPAPLKI